MSERVLEYSSTKAGYQGGIGDAGAGVGTGSPEDRMSIKGGMSQKLAERRNEGQDGMNLLRQHLISPLLPYDSNIHSPL